jgi:uncharacterized RDD family membrane protein YckC
LPIRPSRWYFVLRAFAAIADYAICFAAYFAYARYFGTETDEGYVVSGCGHIVTLFAMWAVLIPLPEAIWGRTFGKWVCDLRVVGLKNEPLTTGQAFVRRIFDPIDLLSFVGLVGYIVAKTNPLSQRVGDLVAKTRVIEETSTASGDA